MKRVLYFYFLVIFTILLNFSFISCSDDELASSTGKGMAMATIDPQSGKTTKVRWVQLWTDGPKFAEYNLGVVDGKPESFGGHYQWYYFFDENDQISNFPWGSNWRIPTREEINFLVNNCTIEWTKVNDVSGIKVSGIGNYASNSIFLPACDSFEDGEVYGFYWTSTPDGVNAYNFGFYEAESKIHLTYNGMHRYRSIRPVLAD